MFYKYYGRRDIEQLGALGHLAVSFVEQNWPDAWSESKTDKAESGYILFTKLNYQSSYKVGKPNLGSKQVQQCCFLCFFACYKISTQASGV